MAETNNKAPGWGLEAVRKFWKDDLKAGISVAFVALPLGLGVALASGAPAMAGITSAIIGGVVATWIRGSHVAINGPPAGLIAVLLTGMNLLRDENGIAFPYLLAAMVGAGLIQTILGLLRQGELGELFPSGVIQGMLAAIGVIIFAKQMHVALGVEDTSHSAMDALLSLPGSFLVLNPFVFAIAAVSVAVLIVYPRISSQNLHVVPAPLWVLIISIPMVLIFNFFQAHDKTFLGHPFHVGPEYLINIPDNIRASIIFPDFSKISTPEFWLVVISITLVATVESLISTKAVDRLDDFKRKTNLNKDLTAVGVGTMVAGFLGGLPISTVIVRSSVNINYGAKTRWSNFYHGIFLLILVLLLPGIIREIPRASLAAIVVYTAYKLASPKVFKNALLKGWEQFLSLIITLIAIMMTDILLGVIIGIISTLLIHWMKSELQFSTFFRHLINPSISQSEEKEDTMYIEVKGICNFLLTVKLLSVLESIPKKFNVVLDFAKSKIVDGTILEHIFEYKERNYSNVRSFDIIGLDNHKTSSSHPQALHVLERPMHKRLTSRQNELLHYSRVRGYFYKPEINWDTAAYRRFRFFEHRILEYHQNMLRGRYEGSNVSWEICDISYNEGILMAAEEHHITIQMLKFQSRIPNFSMTKENVSQLKNMWKEYLKTNDESTSIAIFTTELIHFLLANDSYSIESLGSRMLIYKKERLASFQEILSMLNFSRQLIQLLPSDIEKPSGEKSKGL